MHEIFMKAENFIVIVKCLTCNELILKERTPSGDHIFEMVEAHKTLSKEN